MTNTKASEKAATSTRQEFFEAGFQAGVEHGEASALSRFQKELEALLLRLKETEARLPSNIPVEDLDLTVRAYNFLKRENFHTIASLLLISQADLLGLRSMNQRTLTEIVTKLKEKGYKMRE